jgi:hypothetical protein
MPASRSFRAWLPAGLWLLLCCLVAGCSSQKLDVAEYEVRFQGAGNAISLVALIKEIGDGEGFRLTDNVKEQADIARAFAGRGSDSTAFADGTVDILVAPRKNHDDGRFYLAFTNDTFGKDRGFLGFIDYPDDPASARFRSKVLGAIAARPESYQLQRIVRTAGKADKG